jgi:hypothetical protein
VADVAVELDALESLVTALRSIRDWLAGAKETFEDATESLGSETVADSLKSFSSGWKDGRGKIGGEVDSLAEGLDGALDAYRSTDGALESGFSLLPGGPSGPSSSSGSW